ncbi:DNA binding protein [Rhynchospora pubera]|uniref:DNA binding protein n=1 Tax=Rhynchospora pubera TaxID=906938 RepID=A0AAV8GHW3_9POAL|nr:DNA binding protein [Rhynchospora pubera]KAJ4804554.1 DNA binding protein [Rhynchospora pubera]
MDFSSNDRAQWKAELEAYESRLESLAKADLVSLDSFYRKELPLLLRQRDPDPFISKAELVRLMRWKLSRGKWRPRLLDFVSSLEEEEVQLASKKGFASLPDLSKAISSLTVMKGVGPATASAILAAYAPDIAPFMSDEAMMAAMGSVKEYTLKQYMFFAEKLQQKAKELSGEGECFTASDVERALWSSAMGSKSLSSSTKVEPRAKSNKSSKRKRKH